MIKKAPVLSLVSENYYKNEGGECKYMSDAYMGDILAFITHHSCSKVVLDPLNFTPIERNLIFIVGQMYHVPIMQVFMGVDEKITIVEMTRGIPFTESAEDEEEEDGSCYNKEAEPIEIPVLINEIMKELGCVCIGVVVQ